MTIKKFDFVIIGSGLAGLNSALYASKFGSVALVTKSKLDVSSTYWAQGGIAAALAPGDSPDLHYLDTITSGAGLCHKDAVSVLVNEGKDRILELISAGMNFDKEGGELAFGLEGNHSKRRVIHAGGDATGKEIANFLFKKVLERKNIETYENTHVFNLLIEDEQCFGFHAYNWKIKANQIFIAKSTMIAAGGTSGIFSRTTNPHSSTGDGVSLAFEAGAYASNMEFIQFHPSSFVTGKNETFLISEAVRGEGAYLVNSAGKRFMQELHPLGELAPRDIVSYYMYREMQEKGNFIYLDLRHLDSSKIKERFKNIYSEILKYDCDITKDLIPVAPAAHYMIGGIKTGLMSETIIHGLYASGEVSSTGVHGANRLASNSLLECLVFSERGINHSLNSPVDISAFDASETNFPTYYVDESKAVSFMKIRNRIAEEITGKVGVVRDGTGMKSALEELKKLESSFQYEINEYHSRRLKSLFRVSRLIVTSAIARKESRGGHRREDYPSENPEFKADILQHKDGRLLLEKIDE